MAHTPVPNDPTMDMLQDRITLANAISALEDDAQDDSYTTTIDDNVLPVGAEEMGSGTLQDIIPRIHPSSLERCCNTRQFFPDSNLQSNLTRAVLQGKRYRF